MAGHREHLLQEPGTREWAQSELDCLARKLAIDHGTRVAISGFSTGAGLWWAGTAHQAGLSVWAYQPHPEQTAGWRHGQISEYQRLLAGAERRVILGGRAGKQFFHDRNAVMLSDADVVVAVRDPRITTGGTVAALRELAARRPVVTIDVAARVTTIAGVDELFV